jgi:hypothetical protein
MKAGMASSPSSRARGVVCDGPHDDPVLQALAYAARATEPAEREGDEVGGEAGLRGELATRASTLGEQLVDRLVAFDGFGRAGASSAGGLLHDGLSFISPIG